MNDWILYQLNKFNVDSQQIWGGDSRSDFEGGRRQLEIFVLGTASIVRFERLFGDILQPTNQEDWDICGFTNHFMSAIHAQWFGRQSTFCWYFQILVAWIPALYTHSCLVLWVLYSWSRVDVSWLQPNLCWWRSTILAQNYWSPPHSWFDGQVQPAKNSCISFQPLHIR